MALTEGTGDWGNAWGRFTEVLDALIVVEKMARQPAREGERGGKRNAVRSDILT
jgi:hypothetical protein